LLPAGSISLTTCQREFDRRRSLSDLDVLKGYGGGETIQFVIGDGIEINGPELNILDGEFFDLTENLIMGSVTGNFLDVSE
jgi:hypothetical protein